MNVYSCASIAFHSGNFTSGVICTEKPNTSKKNKVVTLILNRNRNVDIEKQ